MKQLERLLFLQGNVCFFCQAPIPTGEASVEHLVATSNGGAKDDDNCIVCCKTVNAALGSLSVKAKLQAVVNQRNGFVCPRSAEAIGGTQPISSDDDRVQAVVENLIKRGPKCPKKLETLKSTINAVFLGKLSEAEQAWFVSRLLELGYVMVEGAKVSYSLPATEP